MEGLKNDIRPLHTFLKERSKWYLDINSPDVEEIIDITNEAKENADEALSSLTLDNLYQRYIKWRKSDPMVGENEEYLHAFVSQVAFDLGLASLAKENKLLFEDNCYLTFKTIKEF
jgi:hypothetical protein